MKKYFIIRIIKITISVLGGAAVAAGYMTESDLGEIAGAAVIIANAIWTWFDTKNIEMPAKKIKPITDPTPLKASKGFNK